MPSAELRMLQSAGRVDDAAFAELYERTSQSVFLAVIRLLRDPAQSEAVVQEVYLQAWLQSSAHRGDLAAVTTSLLTIAHARAVDQVRAA